jgi:C1A family cysteine protease
MFRFALLAGAQAATLDLTWSDCGAKHATVTAVSPSKIHTGATETITGTGTLDEEVTSATFTATVSALGTKLTDCSGDAKTDILCTLPMGVGTITVKAVSYPLAAGTVQIPVEVKTSSIIPPSLAAIDVAIKATEQNSEDVICLNVHTEQEKTEYAKGFVRMPRNAAVPVATISDEMRAAVPTKLDWTETSGSVSAVKDQAQCGSCWAFSATEGIESGLYHTTGQTSPSLSAAQIVSCDKDDGGCNGGDLPTAFDYVEGANGITTESDYPYSAGQKIGISGSCKSSQITPAVTVTDYKYAVSPCESGTCKNQDEDGLKAMLNTHGPLSICVNAEDWNSYSSGVASFKCSGAYNKLDHCVQLVGYDTTASTPYWKVRNSWGTSWGEKGFIRLPMGENSCGIADEAMYVKAALAAEVV